jgi:hypothetical protein
MAATLYSRQGTTPRKIASSRMRLILMFLCTIALALVIGILGWHYILQPRSYPTQKTSYGTVTANPNVPGGSQTEQTASGSDGAKETSGGTASLSTTVTPEQPTGQFVSNHMPSLSGQEQLRTETSSCTTTPGATCQIRFRRGSVVKSLPAKIAGSDGTALWNSWDIAAIGLTAGTWEITAVAANGLHAVTTRDPINLSVGT